MKKINLLLLTGLVLLPAIPLSAQTFEEIFFLGGVNNCLQIYMRSKRGTPDALGGYFL